MKRKEVRRYSNNEPWNYFRIFIDIEETVEIPSPMGVRFTETRLDKKTEEFCLLLGQKCGYSGGGYGYVVNGDCRTCIFASAYISQNPDKIKWENDILKTK